MKMIVSSQHDAFTSIFFLQDVEVATLDLEDVRAYKGQISSNNLYAVCIFVLVLLILGPIYLVCGNTMCVSTCRVDFVLKRTALALYLLLNLGVDFQNPGDYSVVKRTVLLRGRKVVKLLHYFYFG